jgi:hypothetical protein
VSYWTTSAGLMAFGAIAMFSIGRPFLLVGFAMLALGRLRGRPVLYWPPLVAVIAYNIGYWAVAPLFCTATQEAGGHSTTTCASFIGIGYAGASGPSLAPANETGLLVGVIAFVVVLWAMFRRTDVPPSA